MDVVGLQKICHRGGNLPLEVVKGSPSTPWNHNLLHVLDHGLLVGPMFGRMCDVPIRRKLVAGMTACCYTLVDELDRQKVTHK